MSSNGKRPLRVTRHEWAAFSEHQQGVWTRWFEDRGLSADVIAEFTVLSSGVQVNVYHLTPDGKKHICGHCDGSQAQLIQRRGSEPVCAKCGTNRGHNDACRYLAFLDAPHPPVPARVEEMAV